MFTLPQALPLGYGAFVAERLGLGLFVGGVLPCANALIGKLTDPAQRGTTYGLISSAYFVGNTMGPLTGGAVAASALVQDELVLVVQLVEEAAGLAQDDPVVEEVQPDEVVDRRHEAERDRVLRRVLEDHGQVRVLDDELRAQIGRAHV